jgi:hypothetical protein
MQEEDYSNPYKSNAAGTDDEQASEADMARAIALVESGQSIEQVIGSLFDALPEHVKQKIRVRLQEALAEKDRREHEMARRTRELSEERAAHKLFNLSFLSGLIAKETLEKIQAIFRHNPAVATEIKRQGNELTRQGVQAAREPVSETQLGVMSPPATGLEKDREKDGISR